MRIVIVGCGRVGAGLAFRLARGGHDVIILDVQTDAFKRLEQDFAGRAIRGDGTDESVLRRAGAEGADWFFAVMNGDNRNVLAAQLAAEEFGIGQVVAKINDPVRAEAYAALGIDTIDRTTWMVDAFERYMGAPGSPGATDVSAAGVRHAHGGPDHVRVGGGDGPDHRSIESEDAPAVAGGTSGGR